MTNFIDKIKHINFRKILIVVCIFFSITTLLFFDNMLTKEYKDDSKITYINDGWDILHNGKVYKSNISLEDVRFNNLKKGDIVEFRRILPENWDYKQASMYLHPRQSAFEVYIEDEKVYTYGHDRIKEGKCVGSGAVFVNILGEYKGKEMRIVYLISEDNAFTKVDSTWIADWQDSYRYQITENRLAMFLGIFCTIFGVIVIVISIFALIFAYEYVNIFFLALFSLTLGIWTLCYYNCINIFSIPLYSKSLIEYTTLIISPLPLIIYIKNYVYMEKTKFNEMLYRSIIVFHVLFFIIISTLHTTKIMLVTSSIPYIYTLLGIEIAYLFYVLIIGIKSGKIKKYIIVGLFLIILSVMYDTLSYLAKRYLGFELILLPGISTLGIIIFVNILILNLYDDIVEKKVEKQEKEMLIKRAYTDDLTQMNNRRFCTEYMEKILAEKYDYSIISFDLNGLKETNDKLGHTKGDLLIKRAAQTITNAFGEDGVVGRMGGDEFIAIFKTADVDYIKTHIEKFNKIIDDINKNNEDIPLSIALGYALSTEEKDNNSFETIYNLADNRMYENKKIIKGLL